MLIAVALAAVVLEFVVVLAVVRDGLSAWVLVALLLSLAWWLLGV